jgi:DNA-binding NarL/FixJ family response regulator
MRLESGLFPVFHWAAQTPYHFQYPRNFGGSEQGGFMARILIADDRQLMISALKTIFAMRPKWEICDEATDGREAITKVSELQPDLILMDFKMPLADGIQAARKISANTPSIPIVMYTLYKNDELEAAAKQAGVRSVVSRQDGLLNLLEAIDAELPQAK